MLLEKSLYLCILYSVTLKPYNMKKKLSFYLACILTGTIFAQTHVNREWATTSGNPFALQWSASVVTASNELITTGNTSTSNQGANILTTRYTSTGAVAWQQTFHTSGTNNDYGVVVKLDYAGNIIVCGTTDNGGTSNHDIVLLKYNPSGVLQWSKQFNSSFSKHDAGTALKIDPSNNIYVAGSSEGSVTNNFDYLVLKYTSAGVLSWNARYDYAGLSEVPVKIDIDLNNQIIVGGGSASSATKWDYTIAKYTTAGAFVNATRSTLPGTTGYDLPYDMKQDANGNIYVTGKSSVDGVNYDMKTIKFSPNYNVIWSAVYDGYGKEDLAYSLDLDLSGNVVVAGYATKSNNIKEMVAIKYNSSGVQQWRKNIVGADENSDAFFKAITANDLGEYIVLSEEKVLTGNKISVASKLNADGQYIWSKTLQTSIDELPQNISLAGDGSIYITTVRTSASNSYTTYKYKDYTMNNNVINDVNGKAIAKANELIVKFFPNAMNTNAIDDVGGNKKIEFGDLSYFLTPAAYTSFRNAIGTLCGTETNPQLCNFTAIKIFKDDITTEPASVNNNGVSVPSAKFWTAMLIALPSNLSVGQCITKLNTIPSVVVYSHANYLIEPTDSEFDDACAIDDNSELEKISTGANDNLYNTGQHSLHKIAGSAYNNADVNVEQAWDVIPSGGSSNIRIGVFDDGLYWQHPEFGYDGITATSSKVIDGWDYQTNTPLKSSTATVDGRHGTSVAGIIAATRNNTIGIAGIAGGNDTSPNGLNTKGVSIYGLRTHGSVFSGYSSNITNVCDAIKRTSEKGVNNLKQYGVNIQNHSWKLNPSLASVLGNVNLLLDAVHYANRKNVTVVAARGNDGNSDLLYPACYYDDWVLSAGGTGNDGCFIHIYNPPASNNLPPVYSTSTNGDFTASYGASNNLNNMLDIAAPGSIYIITSTKATNVTQTSYGSFNGTSAAAPHVSGAVALLMSYLNTNSASPTPLELYNNLAPEDCEEILQRSAKDDNCIAGYDNYVGYGRLDIGAALKLVEKPNNIIRHFGTNANSPSTYTKNISKINGISSLDLLEPTFSLYPSYSPYAASIYPAELYKVRVSVNHSIPSDETIVGFWARNSASTGYSTLTNQLLPYEKINILSCNSTSCVMEAYVYKLKNSIGTTIGWLPSNPNLVSDLRFEYSILSKKTNPIGVNYLTEQIEQVQLFPNPSEDVQTLELHTKNIASIHIHLIDMTGKRLQAMHNGVTESGKNTITLNIENIPSGIYFYEIQLGSTKQRIRFVKQ
jgi:hypothetical protein